MAKQNINVGTTANDKKGDSLRAAFVKVNNNFTELYAALGLTDVTLNLGAFTFTGSTMSTDDSTDIVIDKPVIVNGEITVDGDIVPKTNFGASLGTPTRQFKSLYVSTNTVFLGGVPLSLEDGTNELTINNVPISQTINYADIPNAPRDLSDLTDNGGSLGGGSTLVNGAYTVSLGSTGVLTLANAARLQDSASGSISLGIGASGWATAQGAGAIAIGQNAGGEFQSDNTVAVGYYAGSARQGASAVAVGRQAGQLDQGIQAVSIGLQAGYSLQGMFGVAVGSSAGETSQGAGAVAVGQSAGATSQGTSAVAIGQSAGQNYQAANTIILNASGSAVNGVSGQPNRFYVAPIRNIGGTSGLLQYNATTKEITYSSDITSEGNINIDINLSDSTLRRWSFGEDGNLAVPGDINLSGGTISQYSQNGLTGLKLVANADQGQNVTIMGTGNNTFPILNYVGTTLSGITIGTPEGDWNFMNGNLTIPGDIKSNGNINIDINLSDSTLRRWQFGEDGDLTLPAGGDIKDSTGTSVLGGAGGGSTLVNGSKTVSLGSDGNLTLPLQGKIMPANDVNSFLTFNYGDDVELKAGDNLYLSGSVATIRTNGNANQWAFGSTGTLTVPADGIITAPIAQEFQLQAKDANSVLRNEINLDPNNGTYMSVWSDETTSFSSADWGSGSWNNEEGLGAARFTNAQALQNFWLTGIGSTVSGIEVSINGGARSPNVFYENNNGGGYGVYLGLDAVPPGGQGTTVPITSLVFYYRLQSKINMDVTGNEILVDAQAMDLDLRTTLNLDLRANENLNLRGLGTYPVRIYTNGTTHMWEFGTDGKLTAPGNLQVNGGKIILNTGGNAYVESVDYGVNSADSAVNIFGGPYQKIKLRAGFGTQATWTFDTTGTLTFPNNTVQSTAWTGTVGTQATLNVTGAATAERFNTDQITVVGNRISTTVTNANLELECNGSGGVVINAIADATTASTVKSVGYLGLPQSATATDGTLAIGDAGKHIYVTTSGQTIAIPDNASVAYPIGTTLTFIAGPSIDRVLIVVNGGSDTLRLAGSTSTGTRTLAANGMATAVKVASTTWYINGIGLT